MAELTTQLAYTTSFTGAVCMAAALLQWYPDDTAMTVTAPAITSTVILDSYSAPLDPLPSEEEISLFHRLADQWRQETLDLSSLTEIVAHPAYLQIIAMGKAATPLILSELEKKPSHWFVALAAINQTNPVPAADAGNLKKMTEAWLGWGRQRPFESFQIGDRS
jgi:hypothetical protein